MHIHSRDKSLSLNVCFIIGYSHHIMLDINLLVFQASKIVGCKLERQADLTFDFYHGACNTFNQPEEKVLLCFDDTNVRECHT